MVEIKGEHDGFRVRHSIRVGGKPAKGVEDGYFRSLRGLHRSSSERDGRCQSCLVRSDILRYTSYVFVSWFGLHGRQEEERE